MPDASPTRWHLAHTTWFFETFVLRPNAPDWRPVDPLYEVLFNSYYNAVGSQWPRLRRGILSRPTVGQIFEYRARVDDAMLELMDDLSPDALAIVELGLNHEQQHQELMLTDILHVFAQNPLHPVFRPDAAEPSGVQPETTRWREYVEGVREIGWNGDGFAFDNEGPRHPELIHPYAIADRLVTNAEWIEFIEDGGYSTSALWLSEGWNLLSNEGWQAPLYWELKDGVWHQMTLGGLRPVDPWAPVTHVSFFEAEAYATWVGARLPTEAEWEVASSEAADPDEGNFVETQRLQPVAGRGDQFFGDVWEWTSSSYSPYPGYRPADGALGEYNGKFMCNQYVLRGGSCATSVAHIRPTYRNFFPAYARWQFNGLRLARDLR